MSDEIYFASACDLARRIRAWELSAREVVQAHLDQIGHAFERATRHATRPPPLARS